MTQIDELLIRVPGIDAEEAGRLGADVAKLVAEALPDVVANHHLPELRIQMTPSYFNGSVSLSASIAEQVIRQIKLVLSQA